MSDTTRARLAEILYKRGAYCGDCDYESRCPDCDRVVDGYADAILAEFLVVPRSDIVGTEYAYSPAPGHVLTPDDRDPVVWMASHRGGAVVLRPVVAWQPSPLPEDGPA